MLFEILNDIISCMLEIYWFMSSKPSVSPLLVIEANLVLVRLGLSGIYTLLGSHCNSQTL